uniref:Uncharacterized protein n=1 Tax=Parascaris equorum TaxID=6256 RepID=A0A914RIZ1_PAREQ
MPMNLVKVLVTFCFHYMKYVVGQPMLTQQMPGQPIPFMYTPQAPYMQSQFNQNYTTPYPIAYPGTYPGAFNPHGEC